MADIARDNLGKTLRLASCPQCPDPDAPSPDVMPLVCRVRVCVWTMRQPLPLVAHLQGLICITTNQGHGRAYEQASSQRFHCVRVVSLGVWSGLRLLSIMSFRGGPSVHRHSGSIGSRAYALSVIRPKQHWSLGGCVASSGSGIGPWLIGPDSLPRRPALPPAPAIGVDSLPPPPAPRGLTPCPPALPLPRWPDDGPMRPRLPHF